MALPQGSLEAVWEVRTSLLAEQRGFVARNILELQLQGHLVSGAHRILDGTTDTAEENVLPAIGT